MRRAWSWRALFVGFVILLCGTWAVAPAEGRVLPMAVSRSGLMVNGIPIPMGAEPSLAASLSLAELQAMTPGLPELGRGRLHAVIYQLQGAAPPDEVAAFYRREITRPVLLALPPHLQVPAGNQPDDGVRVLSFAGADGFLAIQSEAVSRPARVTVAMVDGSAAPPSVLRAVDRLQMDPDAPLLTQAPALLAPPWETDFRMEGARLQLLQRQLPRADTPGPVVDIMRSLLSQAQAVSFKIHRVPGVIPTAQTLVAFRDEARRSHWRLLSVDTETAPETVALYRFQDDKGMVMLRAVRGQPLNLAPPAAPVQVPRESTEISRFEVTGRINFPALFRPIPAPAPPLSVPALAAPPPHAPFTARPNR